MLRTYTRKPQECRLIEDVMGLCRLCLRRAEDVVPIFAEGSGNVSASLALRITICVGLEIKKEDCLPNTICRECYKALEQCYAFRKRCEGTYQRLKSHLLAVRSRQAVLDQDKIKQENLKEDDLELLMMNGNGDNIKIFEGDNNTINTKQLENVSKDNKNDSQSMDCEELSSLITSVLEKLGVVSRQGGALALARGAARLQLETSDRAVIRLQLEEEPDEEAAPVPLFEECPPKAPLPVIECLTKHQDSTKTSSSGSVAGSGVSGGSLWCAMCGRGFLSRSALRRHSRVHSGERPYACPQCGKAFAQKEVMRRHMFVHKETRPHACASCPKSFTQRNALLLHARSHEPPERRALRLHRCPHCPKLFLYASGLSRHMMAHNGRVYLCGACHKQFYDKSSVLRHVNHAHRGQTDLVTEPATAGDTSATTQ